MTNATIEARVELSGAPPETLQVLRLEGQERLSTPYNFKLTILFVPTTNESAALPIDEIVGDDICVVILQQGEVVRRLHGMVRTISKLSSKALGRAEYEIEIVPRLARATFVSNCRVWVEPKIDDVLREKLRLIGLMDDTDFVLRMSRDLPERPMLVQYRESDFDFVSRLLEHYGLSYYFVQEEDREVLVITDHAAGFEAGSTATYRGTGERLGVFELDYTRRLVARSFVCRDYNYRTPNLTVQSDRVSPDEGDLGGVVEYGWGAQTVDEANQFAKNLADRHVAERDVYRGRSVIPVCAPGHRVTIDEHPDEPPQLLFTEVQHDLRAPESRQGGSQGLVYENQFQAIPATRVPRPHLRTPIPRIPGLLHGVIQTDAAGTIGKAARLDSEGRYLVKLRFDAAATDELGTASCRVRMLQPSAGPGYGMHFPLRPGVEVLIGFIDGDPDRPVIVGAAPNPTTPSPVSSSSAGKNRIRSSAGALIEMDDGT